jgi:hypothetical protein
MSVPSLPEAADDAAAGQAPGPQRVPCAEAEPAVVGDACPRPDK